MAIIRGPDGHFLEISDNAFLAAMQIDEAIRRHKRQLEQRREQADMSAPNHFDIVLKTAQEFPDLLTTNTINSIARFMQILGPRMRERDPRWGFLTKLPAEKHFVLPGGQRVGVDAMCYDREIMQVVDVLTNAADPGSAGPAWQEKERRPSSVWYPIAGEAPPDNGNGEEPDGDLEQRVADLERIVQAQNGIIVSLQQQINELSDAGAKEADQLRRRLGALEDKVANLAVIGPTKGRFALGQHYHDVDLAVVDRRTAGR